MFEKQFDYKKITELSTLILQISVPFLSAAKETEPKEKPPTYLLG